MVGKQGIIGYEVKKSVIGLLKIVAELYGCNSVIHDIECVSTFAGSDTLITVDTNDQVGAQSSTLTKCVHMT